MCMGRSYAMPCLFALKITHSTLIKHGTGIKHPPNTYERISSIENRSARTAAPFKSLNRHLWSKLQNSYVSATAILKPSVGWLLNSSGSWTKCI